MLRIAFSVSILTLFSWSAFAQRVDGPITYPAMQSPDSEIAKALDMTFEDIGLGRE